ncbi:MAG: TIGR02584 family CRISPR-associated protein [Gammaproteobacteria bacterium]|nr:TIGR02584 family CRISPR-associated protein [Gammaproteobacteria bacterium]MBU1723887.1 TIGR02584 family CRISPR-associated protein [Gammaproteobacteria bacterium]MBU2006204.1 TIGR02584 family CRISPR-associated protein [Gammaproteobacteria bacterium]
MSQPDPTQPHTYPRRILVAVEAYSPQTITEALFALSQTTQPPWIPTEVHVITTERGRDQIQQSLLHEGWLARLCADYGLPDACASPVFHLITDPQGKVLWDVRSEQDNEHTADFISQQLQAYTADPTSSVYALLSGGRRTMTYYIGYALSLFGRPQDRLKHVLVDDCYFFLKDFYYPAPQTCWQTDRDGSEFDTANVEVTLADIPFLRLRDGLPGELLAGSSSFSETIAAAQRRFVPPVVHLDWHTATLTCGGKQVKMPPVQLTFYAWMLERRVKNLPPLHWTDEETTPLAAQFLNVYQRLYGITGGYEQAAKALERDGMGKSYFEERKSSVHKCLKKALGVHAAKTYCLHSHGSRPVTRFGLVLPVEVVAFVQ